MATDDKQRPPAPPPSWLETQVPYPRAPNARPEYPPASRTPATVALVLAAIPIPIGWIASVVLSITVLTKPKDSGEHGKGMAVGALAVVALWTFLVVVLILVSLADQAERNEAGEIVKGGDIAVSSLRVGDCVVNSLPYDTSVWTVEVTDCSNPHMLETFATFPLEDGPFPGMEVVERLAEGGCLKRFGETYGTLHDEADPFVEVIFFMPSNRREWNADRTVLCMVTDGTTRSGPLETARHPQA